MPGFDRTGPEGRGPQTGRAMGKCNPGNQNAANSDEETRVGRGFGRGMGRGFGRGFRNRFRNRGE